MRPHRLIITSLLARAVLSETTTDDDNLINSSANTNLATVNATSVLSTVQLAPTVVYEQNVAGQQPITVAVTATATSTASSSRPSQTVIDAPAARVVKADAVSYLIPLKESDRIEALCWYPVSGYYGDLSRYLFYVTLGFALVARTHEWLIIGALAASLTYSAAAAVHACVLIWSGQAVADLDLYAALGILALSAALVVPLLNWSSTIKNIGKDREENSVGRTIIVYWGYLIFLAFLSFFAAVFYVSIHGNEESHHLQFTSVSSTDNITCTPSSGILDLTVDQKQGWTALFITDQFVDSNGCTNPCTGIQNSLGRELSTITRDPKDLIPLNAKQYDYFGSDSVTLSVRQQYKFNFVLIGVVLGVLSLVWVILQGVTVIFFGRRTPSEVRNFIYIRLTKLFSRSERNRKIVSSDNETSNGEYHPELHRFPSFLAKSVAIIFYLWTWSASVVSVLIAILAIVATESTMQVVPQSDKNYQVDQWGAWAATALVLLTAFAYRFQGVTEDVSIRFFNNVLALFYRCCHGRRPKRHRHASIPTGPRETNRQMIWDDVKESVARKTTGLWGAFAAGTRREWRGNRDFLKNGWKAAVDHQGTGHLRRRRNIGAEMQTFPEGWQEKHDAWLEVDEFIAAIKEFDAEHRRQHGKGYLWQPRVTEEAPLREKFDKQLLKDLFTRSKEPNIHAQVYSPATDDVEGKLVPDDEEAGHKPSVVVQAVSMDEHPAFHKSTNSVSPLSQGLTTGEGTPNHTTPSPLDDPVQTDAAPEHPIKRVSTLPVSRYSVQKEPPAEPLKHAATFQDESSRSRRQDDYRPALARKPVLATADQTTKQAPGPAPESQLTAGSAEHGLVPPQTNERSLSTADKTLPPRPSLSLLSLNLSEDTESVLDSPNPGRQHPVTPASRSVMSDTSNEPIRSHSQRHLPTPTSTKISSSNGDTDSSRGGKGV